MIRARRKRGTIVLVATALGLVASFVLLGLNSSKRARLREEMIILEEQEDEADALQAALLDAETLLLDHLASNNDSLLDNYREAKQLCITRLEALRAYENDPLTGKAIKKLANVIHAETAVQEQLLFSRYGEKVSHDEYELRAALDDVRRPLADILDEKKDEVREIGDMHNLYILITGFICLGLLLLNYVHQQRLYDSETNVALLQQDRRFSALMEYGHDAFCLLGAKGEIIFMSPAVKNVLGYAPEEMSGSILDYVYPNEQEKAREEMTGVQASENIVRAVHRMLQKNNKYRWIEIIARNMLSEPGIEAIILNLRDVHDTVAARQQLSESEEKYRLLAQNMRDVITTHDHHGRYTFASSSLKEMLGFEPDEMLGLSPLEFAHPQDHEKLLDSYKAIMEGKSFGSIEFRIRHAQGHYVWVETLSRPLRDANGKVCGFQSSTRNISEQKMLEDELRFQAMLLAELNESVIATDPQDRVIYWNEGSQRLFGYSHREMLGKKPEVIYADENAAFLSDDASMELQARRKDGTLLWLETRATTLRDPEGKIICTVRVGTDVSERKKAQEQMLSAQRELEHFAYAASHDLQEPLRMVSSFMGLLRKRYGDQLDAQAQEYIGFAADGAERMNRLILNLLEYSRTGRAGESPREVDMNKVVENVRLNLHASIAESKAELDAPPSLPVVRGYAVELERLLQNLVENAIKYQNGGDRPRVQISFSEQNDHWQFSVKDNGRGVPPEHAGRIFEPFTRLPGTGRRGSGIGLATCAKIARHHRGRIWVDPAPGGGSVFSFTIDKKMTNV